MLDDIAVRYGLHVPAALAPRFGADPEGLEELGGFEAHVYRYVHQGEGRILKITHSLRRSADYVKGELEWLAALDRAGVPVAVGVPSERGEPVEIWEEDDGHYFLAMSYREVEGETASADDFTPELAHKLGKITGALHQVSRDYRPTSTAYRRVDWHEDDLFANYETYLPDDDGEIKAIAREVLARVKALPQTGTSYGLIHGDIHLSNLYHHHGEITLFDFDDCEYHYYANELAVTLYYLARWSANRSAEDMTEEVFPALLAGYREEFPLPGDWLVSFPDFLWLRHFLLYVLTHHYWPPEKRNPDVATRMNRRREDLLSRRPIVDVDFTRWG